ncbi:hypothetical protein [Agrobacterium rosae]|uniref:hypothetical protein n=1 Tax=Agrobacterium rosae TaxID=1972867 RepID=UPI003BA33399
MAIDVSKLSREELIKLIEQGLVSEEAAQAPPLDAPRDVATQQVAPAPQPVTPESSARRTLLSGAAPATEPQAEEPKKRSFLSQILPETDEEKAALRRSLLMAGANMMIQGGPGDTPTNLLAVVGHGLGAGTIAYNKGLEEASERGGKLATSRASQFKMQSELKADGLRKRAADIIATAAKNGDAGLAAEQLFELAALQTEIGDEAGARDSLDKGQKLQQTMAGKGFQAGTNGTYAPVAGLEDSTTRISAAEDEGKKPNSVKEFEYGRKNPGYVEYERDNKRAGATNVTVEGNKVGSIPAGYQLVEDKSSGTTRMEPIPGSPAAKEATDTAVRKEKSQGIKEVYSDAVTNAIDDIFRLDREATLPTTGMGGSLLKGVPGTNAHDIQESLKTIKSNAAFERLQAMRDASPTGGALGGVSEKELGLLESSYAALEQSQSDEQFKRNMIRFHNTYIDVVHGNRKRTDLYKPDDFAGPSKEPSTSVPSVNTGMPQVGKNGEGFDDIPVGTRYKGPDGRVRTK